MSDHKIGLSLDVKNTNALDRLQHEFKDIGDAADQIRSRFERLDQYSNRMMKNGFGSSSYTKNLRDQLALIQQMSRAYENEARRSGNTEALGRLQSTRQSIGTLSGELEAYGGLQGRSVRGRLGGFGRTAGYAALGYLGTRPLSMFRNGYGEAYGMLPGLANFSQTMAASPGQATNAFAYNMLGSAQGYGYNNQDIFGGAQQLQGAMGRSPLFNNYMKGIAQFGRQNGFDFTQASGYFSSEYQSGMQMNPLQYAVLVANTVNQGNMNGRNAQVVSALQQITQTVSGSMTGLGNGAMQGVSSMYATVGKTGNQALINSFPSIFNEMNSSITGGTSMGPMGQAAQWQALSGGKPMNYWDAMYLQSQGNMGKGPNGKYNWQNKLQYAYNQFDGNSTQDYVQGAQFMGVSPTEMKSLISTFMPNGKFSEVAVNSKAGKKLMSQLSGGDMSPLDKTNQNFTQAAQNFQKASSSLLGAASTLDKVLGAHPYVSAGAGAVAAGVAGHGLLSSFFGGGGGGIIGGAIGGGLLSKGAKSGVSFLGRFGKWFGRYGTKIGLGMDAAGTGLEVGGTAADATGVGAIGGIPANILGGILLGGGALTGWLAGRQSHSSTSTHSSSDTHSSSTPIKAGVNSSDVQQEVQNVVEVLMALRPWSQQIGQWYGNGGSGTSTPLFSAGTKPTGLMYSVPSANPGRAVPQATDANGNLIPTPPVVGNGLAVGSAPGGVKSYLSLINKYGSANKVPPQIIAGIMSVESGGNPYSIYDDTASKSYSFKNMQQYLATGQSLLAQRHNLDEGLMQINSGNGVTLQQAANPNFALNWASNYLAKGKTSTGSWNGAIRYYNGGPGGVNLPATAQYLQKVLNAESGLSMVAGPPATSKSTVTVKVANPTVTLKYPDGSKAGMINLTMEATMNGQ